MAKGTSGAFSAARNSLAGLVATLLAVACGGDGSNSTPSSPAISSSAPISVAVSPASAAVGVGKSVSITATVSNDSRDMGVTWQISPVSGAGILTNATSTTVIYQGPVVAPAEAVVVTITATSKSDPTKSASTSVTVPAAGPAIVVIINPSSATVAAGATLPLSVSLQNDSAHMGVTWAISPATGAGSLSTATATSVVFNAPASAPPQDLVAIVKATSKADGTAVATATIKVPASAPLPIVSIDPVVSEVKAGATQNFVATVFGDPSNMGVSWTLLPASGVGSLQNATSTSVDYVGSSHPTESDQPVTLTATSRANKAASLSEHFIIPAETVFVYPDSALMPIGSTLKVTGETSNNSKIRWTLTQGAGNCSPACGVLNTPYALNLLYTAPAVLPANATVTLTATSVPVSTRNASATILLTNGQVQLVPGKDVDFGEVRWHSSREKFHGYFGLKTVFLTNTGSKPLTAPSFRVDSADPAAFSVTPGTGSQDCGKGIAPGVQCRFTVNFRPQTAGSYTARLYITDNSADSPQQLNLTGVACPQATGCPAAPTLAAAAAATPHASAPKPTGQARVGTRTVSLTDSTRSDPYSKRSKERALLVRFWYPANVRTGCQRADYVAPAVWDYYLELAGVTIPAVTTNSCQDAPVADGAYPVVVFSHGYTGTFADYTFLFEDLASRGYIVASVNHTYEATATAFPDGRFVKSVFGSHLKGLLRTDEPTLRFALSARLADLSFVAGELDRLNRIPRGTFSGHLDLANMAIAGHSLGGLTALKALQKEPRFRAAISMDGVPLRGDYGATNKPVLILDAGANVWSGDEQRQWQSFHGPRFALTLRGAGHAATTDEVWIGRGAIPTGFASAKDVIGATRDAVAAFLDSELQARPVDPLLVAPSAKYPEVELGPPGE